MTRVLLLFWILSALLIVREQKIVRMIIYLAVFSIISSLSFLLAASPDVAMAEAVIGGFSTIIFIIAFEKYYSLADLRAAEKKESVKKTIPHLVFAVFLLALFFRFMPGGPAFSDLKGQYLSMFPRDVGGQNAVTAVYLGYRMYDTLFEALMLLISVVAVIHLSQHREPLVLSGKRRDIHSSGLAAFSIRAICPVLVLFGAYLILNGHVSPGGGFQGGVVLASFFMCRYMIHAIYDIRINRVVIMEKLSFALLILLASYFIFFGAHSFLPIPKSIYLIAVNTLIGMKVACGFLIIFYRFVTYEWR